MALPSGDRAREPCWRAQMLQGHRLPRVSEGQQLREWKKPNSQLIHTNPRNKITSFKTKQLPARAFLPDTGCTSHGESFQTRHRRDVSE